MYFQRHTVHVEFTRFLEDMEQKKDSNGIQ